MPLLGALVIALFGKGNEIGIKIVALLASLVSLAATLVVWTHFDAKAGLMFEERFAWIPAINVDYRLGVDGLSVTMVLLTAVITPLALLAHWKLDRDVKLFFFLFLLTETLLFYSTVEVSVIVAVCALFCAVLPNSGMALLRTSEFRVLRRFARE